MRLLLTTTAMSFALAATNLAVASVSFTPLDSVHPLEIVLTPNFDNSVSLTAETETFYQGDFLTVSHAALEGLSQDDLYSGRGAAKSGAMRFVTN